MILFCSNHLIVLPLLSISGDHPFQIEDTTVCSSILLLLCLQSSSDSAINGKVVVCLFWGERPQGTIPGKHLGDTGNFFSLEATSLPLLTCQEVMLQVRCHVRSSHQKDGRESRNKAEGNSEQSSILETWHSLCQHLQYCPVSLSGLSIVYFDPLLFVYSCGLPLHMYFAWPIQKS